MINKRTSVKSVGFLFAILATCVQTVHGQSSNYPSKAEAPNDKDTRASEASVNLLWNSSFHKCTSPNIPDAWQAEPSDAPVVFKNWSLDNFGIDERMPGPLAGIKVMKLFNPPDTLKEYHPNHILRYLTVKGRGIGHLPPGDYTFSVYLKSGKPNTRVGISDGISSKTVSASEEWQRHSLTTGLKTGQTTLGAALQLPDPDTTVWIAAPQLVQGTNVTAYHQELKDEQPLPPGAPTMADVPSVVVPKVSAPPKIDGVLDDAAWQNQQKLMLASSASGASGKHPSQETEAFIVRDDSHLYIAFRCFEPQIDKLRTLEKNCDGYVHGGDSVEVFLSPTTSAKKYYHFMTNLLGTHYDAIGFMATEWNPAWVSKAKTGKGEWTVEIAIPFSILELGDMDEVWRINLCRNRFAGNQSVEYSCWAPVFFNFHDPLHFGFLKGITMKDMQRFMYEFTNVELKKETDNTFCLSGMIKAKDPLPNKVLVKAEFLNITTEGGNQIVLPLSPEITPFKIDKISIPCEMNVYDLVLALIDPENNQTLHKFSSVISPTDTSMLVTGNPLSAYVEYNYYTDDKTASARVTWESRDPVTVEAKLIAGATGKVINKSLAQFSLSGPSTRTFSFPIEDLSRGDYSVVATAFSKGKEVHSVSDRLRKLPPNPVEVRLNKFTRGFAINHAGFFPVVITGNPDQNQFTDFHLKMFKEQGFNTLCWCVPISWDPATLELSEKRVEEIKSCLDRALKHDIKIIFPINWVTFWHWNRTKAKEVFSGNPQKYIGIYTKAVEKLKDHPAIIAWHLEDEPPKWGSINIWDGFSENTMMDIYKAVKAADPYRPAYVNWNGAWKTTPYGGYECTDVVSHDDYPFSGDQFDLEELVPRARMINAPNVGRKPAFIWLQAYYEGIRYPTPDEVRTHAYLHIIYGTRGIGYWGQKPIYPPLWKEMGQINTESQTLWNEVFSKPDSRQLTLAKHNQRIYYTLWESNSKYYLISINTDSNPVKISLDLATLAGRKVRGNSLLFETGVPVLKDGILTDTLAPFQRRVYVFCPE